MGYCVRWGLVALAILTLPAAAGATLVHTRADWQAGCDGSPTGDSVDGTYFAEISVAYPSGNPNVLAVGAATANLNDPGLPTLSYAGGVYYTSTDPLSQGCNLAAGAIGIVKYNVMDDANPGSSSIQLTTQLALAGTFTGVLQTSDSLFVGFDVFFADPSDPLDGPRTTLGSHFCDTNGCSGFGVDGSGLSITPGAGNTWDVTGTADVDFTVPEGDLRIGIVAFGGINLGVGTVGPADYMNDFSETVTWQIFGESGDVVVTPLAPPIPEPGTAALLLVGLIGLAARRRTG